VTIEFLRDKLALTVVDDGRGFDPGVPGDRDAEHLGLLGMRERARLLGGQVEVRSAPGQGTTVDATIPLAGPRVNRDTAVL
jgi:signal transduction histidine kinase